MSDFNRGKSGSGAPDERDMVGNLPKKNPKSKARALARALSFGSMGQIGWSKDPGHPDQITGEGRSHKKVK